MFVIPVGERPFWLLAQGVRRPRCPIRYHNERLEILRPIHKPMAFSTTIYRPVQQIECLGYYYDYDYYIFSCHGRFLPGISFEIMLIPTAQTSSFTLQYFPYYVWCSK
jgi:hypothetical protein